MGIIGIVALLCVALLHVYIMVLEMFLWDKPMGMKAFNLDADFAAKTKAMGLNQGLYNGFLAAGTIVAVILQNYQFGLFFMACVGIAGIVGGFSVSKKIIFIQTVPAVIAAVILLLKV